MTITRIVTLTAILLGCAGVAHAQAVRLEFHDGRVNLTAQNAPLRTILDEWARLGGTHVVNADRLNAPPVTLELTDVPETQALEIILRGTAGYIAGMRPDAVSAGNRSSLDRILVVPTAGTAAVVSRPATAPPPFGIRQPQPIPEPEPELEPDPDDDPVSDVPPDDDPPARGNTRGIRVGPAITVPRNGPVIVTDEPAEQDDTSTPDTTAAPPNPFGIQTGSSRPGTITPVPPPQEQPRPSPPDPEP